MIQAALTFDPAPAPAPPAVDPHLPEALRRIRQRYNQRLLVRLLQGPIGTYELNIGYFGRRTAARMHDIRAWLWHLGYPPGADPIPSRSTDAAKDLREWHLTDEAATIARSAP